MARRLPGGRGAHEDYVGRAESRFLREALIPGEGGWVVANYPFFGHHDVTGVALTAGRLSLYALPDLTDGAALTEARVAVASAVVGATVEVGLFAYEKTLFRAIPGTRTVFSVAATGLQTKGLMAKPLVTAEMRLFLGVLALNGAPILEGFQAGTVVSGRLLAARTATVTSFPTQLKLSDTTKNYTADVPAVAYLSRDAALVL